MNIITLDFETYYDKDYTLKKLTTEEYINDDRFEVIGVAIKVNELPAVWIGGEENVRKLLVDNTLLFNNFSMLAHNAVFDGAILNWKYNIRPKFWYDTLSMSRVCHSFGGSLSMLSDHYGIGKKGTYIIDALGKHGHSFTPNELEKYGDYCTNDVELTHKLFARLKQNWFTSSQASMIDMLIRMFTEPIIKIDTGILTGIISNINSEHDDVLAPLFSLGFSRTSAIKMLRSNALFADELARNGVPPLLKVSLATGKDTFAFSKTDIPFMNLITSDNEVVRDLVRARIAVKTTINKSRSERMLAVGQRSNKLPIMLNYAGARTFRLSGGDKLNLQNLPTSGRIRHTLTAPPGYSLVVADSSQIEPRLLAYMSGQDDLLRAFREKRDVYSEFASILYNKQITKADATERFVGKTCVLGLGYGAGAEKLRKILSLGGRGPAVHISEQDAAQYVRIYRQNNYHIINLWSHCNRVIQSMYAGGSGVISDPLFSFNEFGVELPNKMRILYSNITSSPSGFEYSPNIRGNSKAKVKLYGGKLVENLTQALAGIIIAEQMVAIGQKYKVAFAVHDEIIVVCRDDEVIDAVAFITKIMSTAPVWATTLPLSCEVGVGKNYGDAK